MTEENTSGVTITPYSEKDRDGLLPYMPHLTPQESAELSGESLNGLFFRFFLVYAEEGLVGTVSLYQRAGYAVSAGPEIFPPFRRRGYASAALTLAYAYAKERGFRLATAQIRTDNEASILLHEKLGFLRNWEQLTNRKGHEVCIYSKIL